ncbi:MAG: hypothetical protein ABFC67_13070 [Mizugakiibacter sp.]|uniref:hypothetical protein n=1 Tax=Mizugakiibacter sp. TaxID=1972610 RepID=UPI00321116F6
MAGRDDPSTRGRTEPTIGDLDRVDAPAPDDGLPRIVADAPARRPAPVPARGPRRQWWKWLLPVLLLAVGSWLVVHQDGLRGLLPRTELNSVLARADQALAAGKLDGSAGDSARELYEAARALEPDNEHALQGLKNVGAAELAQAREALAKRRLDDADAALTEARALLGGGAEVERVAQAIRAERTRSGALDALVERAQQALADGRLDGDDGAAALYRRALATDPGNAVARHGLDRIGDALAQQARAALAQGDRAGATQIADRLTALLPNYGDLPSLRAALAQAERDAQAAQDKRLADGEAFLRAGRFSGEGDDNALAQFNAVLAVDPDNARARAGLGQVAQALIVQASAALDDDHRDEAARLLDQAEKLAPKSADLAAARSRLREAGEQAAIAAERPRLTAAQQAEVLRLVHAAQAAARNGDLMLPPGTSAYDQYRAALAIEGDNAAAQAGLKALPQRAAQLFDQALAQGRLERAADLLSTFDALSPGDAAAQPLKHRLAQAWLDRATLDADQGRLQDARIALDLARRLEPNDPRVGALAQRLAGAGG